MPSKQTIVRYAPPQLIHWGKSLVSPDYRRKARELSRLRALPRYRRTTTNILGKTVEAVDGASFVSMYGEIFEQQIYRFETKNPQPYIIDGGANIGLSVLYFKRLYPASRILAFEADEEVFSVLKKNVETSGHENVEMVCRALWSSETRLSFMSEGADGGRVAQGKDAGGKLTETVRLRSYLTRPVDFLKLDIEGAETEVLRDSADLLGNVEKLFVEYHSFAEGEQTLATLVGVLADAGFRLHVHTVMSSPQPFVSRRVDGGYDMQLNIFAFRQ